MTIGPLLAALVVSSHAAQARPPAAHPPRVYAAAALTLASHPASSVYYRNLLTAVSGHSWDLSAGGGAFVSRAVAVEGELVYGGAVSTPQSTFFVEHARDVMLSALVRFRPQDVPRLQLLAGGGWAWTRTWEDPPQTSRVPERSRVLALTFGADVLVADTRHAAIAPSFRVRWLNRELDFGPGLGRVTYQIGATVFFR